MDKKDIMNIIPSDARINSISPGALAIERFKLAMALNNEEDGQTSELGQTLMEEDQ